MEVEIGIEGGVSLLVDDHTGEVLYELVPGNKSERIRSIHRQKPIRLKYDMSNPGEAKARSLARSHIERYTVCEWIGDLVTTEVLTPAEIKVFCFIGYAAIYNNCSYVTTQGLVSGANTSKSSVSRAVQRLEELGFIKELYRNTFGVGSRVYEVCPRYFWKGEFDMRNKARNDWYLPKHKDAVDRLMSQDILV